MITEVRNKIYSLGAAVTGLSGKFYYIEAPQGTDKPYAAFQLITNTFNRDSCSVFEELVFQIVIYGTNLNAVETLEKSVKEKFDDSESSWSLADWYCNRIEREFCRADKFDNTFQIVIQYKLDLTKK